MWKAVSVDVALEVTISVMSLPLPGEPDLFALPDASQELMQELPFCVKGS